VSSGKPGVSDSVFLVNKPAPIPPTIGTMFLDIDPNMSPPIVLLPSLVFFI
jgi:hypothetical protein